MHKVLPLSPFIGLPNNQSAQIVKILTQCASTDGIWLTLETFVAKLIMSHFTGV